MVKRRRASRWKYTVSARRIRFCERCEKRLKKGEVKLCHECYLELLAGNVSEVKK